VSSSVHGSLSVDWAPGLLGALSFSLHICNNQGRNQRHKCRAAQLYIIIWSKHKPLNKSKIFFTRNICVQINHSSQLLARVWHKCTVNESCLIWLPSACLCVSVTMFLTVLLLDLLLLIALLSLLVPLSTVSYECQLPMWPPTISSLSLETHTWPGSLLGKASLLTLFSFLKL